MIVKADSTEYRRKNTATTAREISDFRCLVCGKTFAEANASRWGYADSIKNASIALGMC